MEKRRSCRETRRKLDPGTSHRSVKNLEERSGLQKKTHVIKKNGVITRKHSKKQKKTYTLLKGNVFHLGGTK